MQVVNHLVTLVKTFLSDGSSAWIEKEKYDHNMIGLFIQIQVRRQ